MPSTLPDDLLDLLTAALPVAPAGLTAAEATSAVGLPAWRVPDVRDALERLVARRRAAGFVRRGTRGRPATEYRRRAAA